MKKNLQFTFLFVSAFMLATNAKENKGVIQKRIDPVSQNINCAPSTAQADLNVNNVRARILNSSDRWWDPVTQTNYYEVPIGSNKNSIYAGAMWFGGFDGTGSLHVAAQTYRQTGANDFWPGPISKDPVTDSLSITAARCLQFDRFWSVSKTDVLNFIGGGAPTQDIISWPGNGDVANGELQFLAPFFDANSDGIYDYTQGDYPLYNFSASVPPTGNCNDYLSGDQNLWWVFNDIGDVHTQSLGDHIGIEVRAQAFAFNSANVNVNNATFYKYQIINRSSETYLQCYIGQWVDPDLGNAADDYVGCNVTLGLGFCYNADPDDDGASGYGLNPPAVGTDFLQGPLADAGDGIDNNMNGTTDEPGEECTMSKFVYYKNMNNSPVGNPDFTDDYYQYLDGIWLDGQVITRGEDGRNPANPATNFMFSGTTDPAFPASDWTMPIAGIPGDDMRYLQSAGKFTLDPGEVNYVTIAAEWARDTAGPLSSLTALNIASDDIQTIFNNCFIPLGINENSWNVNVICSPNPFNETTIIRFNNPDHQNITLQVYDLRGKLVRNLSSTRGNSFTLEKNEINSGVYLYRLMSENKSLHSGKIIVQ